MAQSLYSASIGMKTQQNNIDTIANNIANVNTTAYKKSRVNFKDATYSELTDPSRDAQEVNLQLGHGSLLAGQSKSFDQGFTEETGRSLDAAIQGDGFFAIETTDNETAYTRSGAFTSKNVNGTNYLTTVNGDFVLDSNGQKIKCNFPIEQIHIGSDGEMTNSKNSTEVLGKLGVFIFTNPEGLEELGNLTFRATEASGEITPVNTDKTEIKQGFLEKSNVDITEEMTQLMKAQRAYTFLSRAITTADQMKSIENDIRR